MYIIAFCKLTKNPLFVQISTSVPSKQTTAASMQSVLTPRDPSFVAAKMDLVEMASIVLVTRNFV